MSLEPSFTPPKFKSRKEFMDFLQDMMTATIEGEVEPEFMEETRGRPRELKTYIMESNDGAKIANVTSLIAEHIPTDLPEVSILRARYVDRQVTFFIDASDPRFLVLYTNDLADVSDFIYNRLVVSTSNKFDKIWLPAEVLDSISNLRGNLFRGFGLMFDDLFSETEQEEQPVHELTMNVSGSNSADALEALNERKELRRSLSRSMIRVRRGNKTSFVADELRYNGRLITKSGASIDDHVSLAENTKKTYRQIIEAVEKNSLGTRSVEGRTLIEGQAFDLTLERQIENLDFFIEQLLSPDHPFRLWGLRNKISKDKRQIVAVDLHTGDPLDMEITSSSIRVYLHQTGCGNTVLRLYTNLQHYFDSAIRLDGEGFGTK